MNIAISSKQSLNIKTQKIIFQKIFCKWLSTHMDVKTFYLIAIFVFGFSVGRRLSGKQNQLKDDVVSWWSLIVYVHPRRVNTFILGNSHRNCWRICVRSSSSRNSRWIQAESSQDKSKSRFRRPWIDASFSDARIIRNCCWLRSDRTWNRAGWAST